MLNLTQFLKQEISRSDYLTAGFSPRSSRWAILLLRFNNEQNLSASAPSLNFYERLFTGKGAGTLNIPAYFSDISHGQLDLSASKVFDWMTIDANRSDYVGNIPDKDVPEKNSTVTASSLSAIKLLWTTRSRSANSTASFTHSLASLTSLASSVAWPSFATPAPSGRHSSDRK